jgi:MFS family permease
VIHLAGRSDRFSRLERLLIAGNLVNALGDGMFGATSILFFTTVRGFRAAFIGEAMALAGGLALGLGVPVGRAADRLGSRAVLVTLTAIEGTAVLSYAWIHNFWVLVLALCAAVVANRSAPGVRNAYIARAVAGPERRALRALLRAVTNVGLATGSGIAAAILAIDDRASGYEFILGLDAVKDHGNSRGVIMGIPHLLSAR